MEHVLTALAGLGLLPDPDPFERLSEREVAIRTAFRGTLDEALGQFEQHPSGHWTLTGDAGEVAAALQAALADPTGPHREAAFPVLVQTIGGPLYLHPKSGGVYLELLRRPAHAPLYQGEQVCLGSETTDAREAKVTDNVQPAEDVVFYRNVVTGQLFARPARLFDEPGRFVRLDAPVTVEAGEVP